MVRVLRQIGFAAQIRPLIIGVKSSLVDDCIRYNLHAAVRRSSSASALASTIACASCGSRSSINSVEPLMSANGAVTSGSAARDLQHAVCAATVADVLVTHDQEFEFLLGRAKTKRFLVIRLKEL